MYLRTGLWAAGFGLAIGSPLVVEITQDRGSAPAAVRHRAACDVAARPEFYLSRFGHRSSSSSRHAEQISR